MAAAAGCSRRYLGRIGAPSHLGRTEVGAVRDRGEVGVGSMRDRGDRSGTEVNVESRSNCVYMRCLPSACLRAKGTPAKQTSGPGLGAI
eukprot:gene9297-biopygen15239